MECERVAVEFQEDGSVVLTQWGYGKRENLIVLTAKQREHAAKLLQQYRARVLGLPHASLLAFDGIAAGAVLFRLSAIGQICMKQIDGSREEVNIIFDCVQHVAIWLTPNGRRCVG